MHHGAHREHGEKRFVSVLFTVAFWVASLGLANADMAPAVPVPDDPAVVLQLPPGFSAQLFARLAPPGGGYAHGPRFMAFDPDGNLYLSLGLDNKVVMLPDRDHDGRADAVITVADKLNGPQGLAFVQGKLYVADQDGVVRLEPGDGKWPATAVTTIISNLPTGGHTMKSLKLGPDGLLYLDVGSSCNVCEESDPLRATLLRYSVDGRPAGALASVGRHPSSPILASGLRNSQGFAWHPLTGALYATNDGADMRSDTKDGKPLDALPPEHLNLIGPGQHYGWPYCWGERVTDPNFPGAEGFCATTQPPAITFPAHTTPIGITFLDKSGFPADYQDDALVALHGSWNRVQPAGYKVVRVHFVQGRPASVSDFITGWLNAGSAWGRPVDIVVGPDGAAYISDDRAGMIYRVVYRKGAGQ